MKPDIPCRKCSPTKNARFWKIPTGRSAQSETNSSRATNNPLPFIDHTTEADLVREKIKDGDEDENLPPRAAEPPKPFIRDPVLARAVDLIKGLAVVRESHAVISG